MLRDDIYNFDALDEAEKITGKDYHDDRNTALLGMLLQMEHSRNQNQMLKQMNDTTFCMDYQSYIEVAKDVGFKQVDEWKFSSEYSDKEVMSHWLSDDGMYLIVESFQHSSRNSAYLYFAWESDITTYKLGLHCSCHYLDGKDKKTITIGDLDVRIGLRHAVELLRANGTFLNPFPEPRKRIKIPYSDTKNYDYDNYETAMEKRIKMLHPDIKKLLNLKDE